MFVLILANLFFKYCLNKKLSIKNLNKKIFQILYIHTRVLIYHFYDIWMVWMTVKMEFGFIEKWRIKIFIKTECADVWQISFYFVSSLTGTESCALGLHSYKPLSL